MSVKLCKRTLKSGNIQFYLAIYTPTIGKKFETLFTAKPSNLKEKKALAETIRTNREIEVLSKGTTYIPKHKKNLKLYDYFDNFVKGYEKKDIRVINNVINKFKKFNKNSDILISELRETDVINFIDYLKNKSGLTGESPKTYYRRFKKIILQANRDNYIDESIYKNVMFSSKQQDSSTKLSKNVLTEEEITTLFSVECGNNELKRAFLFSCYTGVGLAEIKVLKWANIKNNRLIIDRCKTGTEINIQLSPKAIELIGKKTSSDSLIFDIRRNDKFISEVAINKTLKNWMHRAGIDKKITFYCGRHTFATRLLIKGANLKTVSDSLAQTSPKHTIKYLNYVNSLKDEATSNL